MYLVVKNNVFSFFYSLIAPQNAYIYLFSFKKRKITLNICYVNYHSGILISKKRFKGSFIFKTIIYHLKLYYFLTK